MVLSQLVQGLILGAVGILLSANIVVIILGRGQRSLRIIWLTALAGAGLAWLLIIVARMGIPYQLVLIHWQNAAKLFTSSPLILLDVISWSFALALSTLMLSVLLTAASRLPGLDWKAWSGSLVLAVIALIAIIAGNPLTVLLAWAALDLVEVLIWLVIIVDNAKQRNIVIILSTRVLGLAVVFSATLLTVQNGAVLNFDTIPLNLSPFLILAVGIRLGVVPLQAPFHGEIPMRQGLGTMLRLAPFAANLAFLTRMADVGVHPSLLPYFLVMSVSVALFSAVAWIQAHDELTGRPFWLLVTASMAVLAAVLRQPEACLAWGVTSVLSGGFIFLSSIRHRYLIPLTLWAVLGLTMLPFTPTWLNARIYSTIWWLFPTWAAVIIIMVLLIIHALFVFGFLRHGMRIPAEQPEPERWIWLLYPPGLAGLLLSNFAWGWINQPSFGELKWLDWLAGPTLCILIITLWFRIPRQSDFFTSENMFVIMRVGSWKRFLSLNWAGLLIKRIFQTGNYLIRLVNTTLEGEGGVLWAFVLLILFFSLVIQLGQTK